MLRCLSVPAGLCLGILFGFTPHLFGEIYPTMLAVNAGIALVRQPASQTVKEGQFVSLSVEAAHDLPLNYQWEFNGAPIQGAIQPSLTIPHAAFPDAGDYTVLVTAESSSVRSAPAILTILPSTSPAFTVSMLVHFDGINGARPEAAPMQTSDGQFYGTTSEGGAFNMGTVYKMSSDGTLTTLVSFDETNGSHPFAGLILARDGQLYGTTSRGGAHNRGTIYKVTSDGALTTIYSFLGAPQDGAFPRGEVIQGLDGNFYGTTYSGGADSVGTVFKMTPEGIMTILASFYWNAPWGYNPQGPLVQTTDGMLFGTTLQGGAYGTVFKITPEGVMTILTSFDIFLEAGGFINPELIEGPDGQFYGTTRIGGHFDRGVIFKVSAEGQRTTLASLGGPHGEIPRAGLVLGPDGNFYGTTAYGGPSDLPPQPGVLIGNGTVFRMLPNGKLTTLLSFQEKAVIPTSALTVGADGNLYGTTTEGGRYNSGTLFRLNLPSLMHYLDEDHLTVTWRVEPGKIYQLQHSSSLAEPDWSNLGGQVMLTNSFYKSSQKLTDTPQRFFRLLTIGE